MLQSQPVRRNLDLEAALTEARNKYAERRPRSAALHAEAKTSMPGGNTRTVIHFGPYPFTISRGDGAHVHDADGFVYADFLGEYTAGLYGHNNPLIEAAVKSALKGGVALGGPNLVEAKLAALLCQRFAAPQRIRFCNSGTEANILALSTARAHTGRDEILVMDGAYHGSVLTFAGASPLNLPFTIHRTPYNDAEMAVAKIKALGERLAAVLIEPMIGAGGCVPASHAFLAALRKATEESGAMLIFDEVMTSRLTAGGLQGYHGITPDLASFGKYLGGGLTFGAFGGAAEIMERFDPARPDHWPHAGTFNNNILSMTAGYTGLSEIYTAEVADAFFDRGNAFRTALQEDLARLDLPVVVTGMGSMTAFHFTRITPTTPPVAAEMPKDLLELIHLDMAERGQFHARRGMFNLSLPMTDADLEGFRRAFVEVLEERAPLIETVIGHA